MIHLRLLIRTVFSVQVGKMHLFPIGDKRGFGSPKVCKALQSKVLQSVEKSEANGIAIASQRLP